MFELVHFLHIAAGVVFGGGLIVLAFVVEPVLLTLPPEQMRLFLERAERFAGPVMGISGVLVLVTGPARAWIGGGITSLADLLSPYGLFVIAAFVIALGLGAENDRERAAIQRILRDEADPVPSLRSVTRRHRLAAGVGLLAIVIIMTILGLGLY